MSGFPQRVFREAFCHSNAASSTPWPKTSQCINAEHFGIMGKQVLDSKSVDGDPKSRTLKLPATKFQIQDGPQVFLGKSATVPVSTCQGETADGFKPCCFCLVLLSTLTQKALPAGRTLKTWRFKTGTPEPSIDVKPKTRLCQNDSVMPWFPWQVPMIMPAGYDYKEHAPSLINRKAKDNPRLEGQTSNSHVDFLPTLEPLPRTLAPSN